MTIVPSVTLGTMVPSYFFVAALPRWEFRVEIDEELCLCFHVTKRKVLNYIRIEKPKRPGQLSDCYGAGTGCGWCRPFLQRLFEQAVAGGTTEADLPTAEDYAKMRAKYVHEGGGTPPPGATPIPATGDGHDDAPDACEPGSPEAGV